MKKLVSILAALSIMGAAMVVPNLSAKAANGPLMIYNFEGFTAGKTIQDAGIGYIASTPKPKAARITKADEAQYADGESVQGLLITNGGYDITAPSTIQQIVLKVPEGRQDWSAYTYFAFRLNNALSQNMTTSFVPFFMDADGECWGLKAVAREGYFWFNYDSSNMEAGLQKRVENVTWGGLGFVGTWFNSYIGLEVTERTHQRYNDNMSQNGNNKFDRNKITHIIFRVDAGAMGSNEDLTIVLDNLMACNEIGYTNGAEPFVADGVDVRKDLSATLPYVKSLKPLKDLGSVQEELMEATTSSTPQASSSSSPAVSSKPTTTTTTSAPAIGNTEPDASAPATDSPGTAPSEEQTASVNDIASDDATGDLSDDTSNEPDNDSDKDSDKDSDNGLTNVLLIVLIVIGVILIAGGGSFAAWFFLVYAKKNTQAAISNDNSENKDTE